MSCISGVKCAVKIKLYNRFNNVRKATINAHDRVNKVVPGCVVGKEILRIRHEPWKTEASFKGFSPSGIYLRTTLEFKSTSCSAVRLSLTCVSLRVSALTHKIYNTVAVHEVNTLREKHCWEQEGEVKEESSDAWKECSVSKAGKS